MSHDSVFTSEDDEAAYWLALLRDGDDAAQVEARDGLSRIFARRGMWSEVAALCESQIAHGVRTPQMYQRLAAAYSNAGDTERAEAVLAEAPGARLRLRSRAVSPEPTAPAMAGGVATTDHPEPIGIARRVSDPETGRTKLSSPAIKVVMFVLIFGVGNLLLVGGQKIAHWKDQSRLDEIHRQLDAEKGEIDRLEGQLKTSDSMLSGLEADLDAQEARIRDVRSTIDGLSAEIDAVERGSAGGVPSSLYARYSQMVDDHNRLVDQQKLMVAKYNRDAQQYNGLLSRFQADSKTYDDKIEHYNAQVNEGNGLARTIGTTWFIVPVPRGGAHGHVTSPARR